MHVTSFWEGGRIPSYLALCVSTWHEAIQDIERINLNWSNWTSLIGDELPLEHLVKQRFAKQSDAVSAVALAKWRGMTLDLDTIIAPHASKTEKPFWSPDTNGMLRAYGIPGKGIHVAALNVGDDTRCEIPDLLVEELRRRLYAGGEESAHWGAMGPLPLENMMKDSKTADSFDIWPRKGVILEEAATAHIKGIGSLERYQRFYFSEEFANTPVDKALSESPTGLILLHNSWTPDWFMKLTIDEVLTSKTLMGSILRELADTTIAKNIIEEGI